MEPTDAPSMRIIQIVPEVRIGSGVEAVAYHLEQEWQKLGIQTGRFTLADAAGGWLPTPGPGLRGKLVLAARVIWFSTVGTVLARRMLARQPAGTVSICHNDVLAGNIYVNHGVVAAAMKARGNRFARMLRNPLHLFVWLRDRLRFRSKTHRVVVNLCATEVRALSRTYSRISPRTVVIGNGVDIRRYRPDPAAKARARERLGILAGTPLGVFVGHEFGRKGLPSVLRAMAELSEFQLVVVGGTADMIADARKEADRIGVEDRVKFVGKQVDPRPYFHAGDVFVFPSAYESYGLVVLEALACGLPVVATAVGCVPDVVVDGVNGAIVPAQADGIRDGIRRTLAADQVAQSVAARAAAEEHSWAAVAQEYLHLAESLAAGRR